LKLCSAHDVNVDLRKLQEVPRGPKRSQVNYLGQSLKSDSILNRRAYPNFIPKHNMMLMS
jgi:hypothetical protein